MAEIVYGLCAILSMSCAFLLYRGYSGGKSRLLLWSSLGFAFLALNNIVLFVDNIIFPEVDFGGLLLRNLFGAIGGSLLLFGLIWESP